MNRIKFFGSVGMVMFIMWLCFWMFGGWYVKGSFETFSYIWQCWHGNVYHVVVLLDVWLVGIVTGKQIGRAHV